MFVVSTSKRDQDSEAPLFKRDVPAGSARRAASALRISVCCHCALSTQQAPPAFAARVAPVRPEHQPQHPVADTAQTRGSPCGSATQGALFRET